MSKPFIIRGKCSFFGGPNDSGVSVHEDLALYERPDVAKAPPGLFLPTQPSGTTGTARRLNPDAFYIAMRWAYHPSEQGKDLDGDGHRLTVCTPRAWLKEQYLLVSNPKRPDLKPVKVRPVDWGPDEFQTKGRVADLSNGVGAALHLQTDDEVTIEIPV